MQTLDELQSRFGVKDHVVFEEPHAGLVCLRIAAAASDAVIYLQGAHIAEWTPKGGKPVLYLSPKSAFAQGKAIRGGIPVLFPWFGDRWNREQFDAAHGIKSPAHGFARTQVWTVERTHLSPDGEVWVVLSLGPSEQSRSLGYDHFTVTMEFRIGAELHVVMTVVNHAGEPMEFEEGLHTYFAVADVHAVRLQGLRGSTYLDKRDEGIRKVQRETEFAFTRDVDQVHVHTPETVVVQDAAGGRAIHVAKKGSMTTVIWNPWSVLTPGFADLPEDGWQKFVCVETVNSADDRITLAAGASHGMALTVSVA